jgi:hypothetical protein
MTDHFLQPMLLQMQAQIADMQATIEQQQTEITELKIKRADLIPAENQNQPTSRRKALKRLAVVATASAIAGTALLSTTGGTAEAASGSTPFVGFYAFPGVNVPATGLPETAGVAGSTENSFGNDGTAIAGVYGFTKHFEGSGVRGESVNGYGVIGKSQSRTGVYGTSQSQMGVRGTSATGYGIYAESTNSHALVSSSIHGNGIQTTSFSGKAIYGRSDDNYGAAFYGGKAPLRLEPSNFQVGPPVDGDHLIGEFFVDKEGKLFYCMVAGTPGRWILLSQIPANQ